MSENSRHTWRSAWQSIYRVPLSSGGAGDWEAFGSAVVRRAKISDLGMWPVQNRGDELFDDPENAARDLFVHWARRLRSETGEDFAEEGAWMDEPEMTPQEEQRLLRSLDEAMGDIDAGKGVSIAEVRKRVGSWAAR